jgi:hypothetical protein
MFFSQVNGKNCPVQVLFLREYMVNKVPFRSRGMGDFVEEFVKLPHDGIDPER